MPTQLSETNLNFLRALRGGPMDSQQFAERYKTSRPNTEALAKTGLIEVKPGGGTTPRARRNHAKPKKSMGGQVVYHLTEAGRAACPPRNPLSALPRPRPAPCGDDVRGPTGGHSARRHGRVIPEIAL